MGFLNNINTYNKHLIMKTTKGSDELTQVNQKLRTITRRDLPIGYQSVQSGHAAIQFQHEHSELAKEWYQNSNYLIFLTVENEFQLEKIIEKSKSRNINLSIFREPDIGDKITAITLEPCVQSEKITRGLKLLK